MKKRVLSLFVCCILFFSTIPSVQAVQILPNADSSASVLYLADGSYIITELHEDQPMESVRAAQTKSGSKTSTAYSASGNKLCSLTVHGTFHYDGSSASAQSASYSYTVDASGWSLSSASAYCSGASAIATGSFQYLLQNKSLTVKLTCSSTGVLS